MGKFQPGKSGNPGGRPAIIAEVQDLARQHTADAMETLAAIMRDPKASPAARVSAASAILDRGYGKPLQTIDRPERSVMSDEELMAIAAGGEADDGVSTAH